MLPQSCGGNIPRQTYSRRHAAIGTTIAIKAM